MEEEVQRRLAVDTTGRVSKPVQRSAQPSTAGRLAFAVGVPLLVLVLSLLVMVLVFRPELYAEPAASHLEL